MQLPDLSSLPNWAQALIYAILGLCLAIGFLVSRFGWLQGQKAAAAPAGQAQVAAVIVDPSALNRLTAAVEGLNATQIEAIGIAKDQARATGRMADEMDRLREEMRVLMARRTAP